MRTCGEILTVDGRRMICTAGHSFDLARSGYCNLLQPQDRRSLKPGDSRLAVEARRRFLDSGHGTALARDLIDLIVQHQPSVTTALELGSGEGFHLNLIRERFDCDAHGIDLSVPAAELAARRYGQCTWIVANVDHGIPYSSESFSLLASITGPRHATEMSRVLSPKGLVVIAVPAADDLIELREIVLGTPILRDRSGPVEEYLRDLFVLEARQTITRRERLSPELLRDLLAATYRGARQSRREASDALKTIDVTTSRDVLLFRKR
ncbi:MAG TPA: methyltransferase domain-containing protein [Thermoanaerobaculia bacterium]|nr:methyltransferase domain-containing protein [Thermoanaerobaculia bacterium]